LRVAIVGYGLAGRVFHGPLIAATPGLRVDAIVTANPERQAEARRDFPDAVVLPAPENLWSSRDGYDLAVIATASGSHVTVAAAAIDAGIAVVVEKPIATSAPSARSLAEHASARDVLLVPFLNRRWDSDHLTLCDLLAERRLGKVLRYESRFERWRPTPASGWRENRGAEMGGGILLDLGAHLVDQATVLFGAVDQVYAEVQSRRGGADDDVFLALHHESGVLSHLWASALAAAPGPRLRVLGDRAAFVVEAPRRPGGCATSREPAGPGWIRHRPTGALGPAGSRRRRRARPHHSRPLGGLLRRGGPQPSQWSPAAGRCRGCGARTRDHRRGPRQRQSGCAGAPQIDNGITGGDLGQRHRACASMGRLMTTPPLLMIPGPTPVAPDVLAALAEPVRSHTGPENAATLLRIQRGVRRLMGSADARVHCFAGAGTLAMEAALVNHAAAGERIVVVKPWLFW